MSTETSQLRDVSAETVINTPFPEFSWPLNIAVAWLREAKPGEDNRLDEAIKLLDHLRKRYPHALQCGQEYALALMQADRHGEAQDVLRGIEPLLGTPDEEFLSRWGRMFKDHGDKWRYDKPTKAERFYRRACEKYEEAYRVRSGHYPGINFATLLLIRASLAATDPDRQELLDAAAKTARELIADRKQWPRTLPDDDIWHAATQAEAHFLLKDWDKAYDNYAVALGHRDVKEFHRRSISKQAARIRDAHRTLGETDLGKMNDFDRLLEKRPAEIEATA